MQHKNPELKEKIYQYINEYRTKTGHSPSLRQIGENVGLNYVSVRQYLLEMESEHVMKYEPLRKSKRSSVKKKKTELLVPLLGSIPCGDPTTEEECIEGYIEVPISLVKSDDLFFLRASGDSMIDAHIVDGDLVLFRRAEYAHKGQIVAALVDHMDSTLKTFMTDENGNGYLHPENDRYDDIFPTESLEIQGIFVALFRISEG